MDFKLRCRRFYIMDKKVKHYVLIGMFSLLFGITYSLAMQLYNTGEIGISFVQLILAGAFCGIILILFYKISILASSTDPVIMPDVNYKKQYIIFFIIIMISYTLCLLTYFPGVGMNDGLNIMYYGLGTATQFPVFYVTFITILAVIGKALGSLQISIILYSVCQVVVVSAITAWLVMWFWTRPVFKWLKYVTVVYYVASPLLAMYSVAMLKDTVFSLFLTVLMVLSYEIVNGNPWIYKGKNFWLIFAMVSAGIVFTRNNGSFIIVPFFLVLLIVLKEHRKNLLFAGSIAFFSIILSMLPLKFVHKEPLFQEKAGIPLQQIAAVVANGEGKLTNEQASFIGKIMPLDEMRERYNPASADPIKWNHEFFDRNFLDNHKMEFLKVWAQMLPDNFSIYVKAYLQQTFYFWAPLQKDRVQCFYTIETYADNEWLVSFTSASGIHDQPLLPATINNMLRGYYNMAGYFFREGVLFWIMLAGMLLIFLKKHDLKSILPYLPGLLLWSTIMISTPVNSSLRYVLTFVYSFPFYFGFLMLNMPALQDIYKKKGE